MNLFFCKFQKAQKKHEIKFLQVNTHIAFDSGSVYFNSECQGLDRFSRKSCETNTGNLPEGVDISLFFEQKMMPKSIS